jgi:hypothetical protein
MEQKVYIVFMVPLIQVKTLEESEGEIESRQVGVWTIYFGDTFFWVEKEGKDIATFYSTGRVELNNIKIVTEQKIVVETPQTFETK